MSINLNKPKLNILLIQFKPAGDVLLLTPAIKAIKAKYPSAAVSFLVNEKESILIKDFKQIDNLILLKKTPKNGLLNYLKYIKYNFSLIRVIRKKKFDAVIDFIGNPKSSFITLLSKAPLRIGRKLRARSFAYNIIIPKPDMNTNTVLKRLAHLKPLNIDADYVPTELSLNEQDKKFGINYYNKLNISPGRKIVILAPNSPRSSRRWKPEYFARTGSMLQKQYNAKIILVWGPGEENYTKTILAGISSDAEMIPSTTLTEMSAIISGADLIITNDSSPKHIANALGVRSITIYGPTNPHVWNNIDFIKNPALRSDVPCIQCEKRVCPQQNHICMESLTPDIVLKKVSSIFNS